MVSDDQTLINFMNWALVASPEDPVLIDRALDTLSLEVLEGVGEFIREAEEVEPLEV